MNNDVTKNYGQSIMKYPKVNDIARAIDDELPVTEYNKDEIDKMREELKKSGSDDQQIEVISVDAGTGIKQTTVQTAADELAELEQFLMEDRLSKQILTKTNIEMIKQVLGEQPSEELLTQIATYIKNTDSLSSIESIEQGFGSDICDKIQSLADGYADYEKLLMRFASQIHENYHSIADQADDMKSLMALVKTINTTADTYSEFDGNEDQCDLTKVQETLNKFTETLKNLDERNKRLTSDYKIDDIDTRIVDEVKKCLDAALSLELIYNKIAVSAMRMTKEFNNERDCNSSIDRWISTIKNDKTTVYTFPVNDFLSTVETRKKMIEYFVGIQLSAIYEKGLIDGLHPIEITDTHDLGNYLIANSLLSKEQFMYIIKASKLVLYVLSRTFKVKSANDDDINSRRILSYTLDMISKLGVPEYREKFNELIKFAMKSILNM